MKISDGLIVLGIIVLLNNNLIYANKDDNITDNLNKNTLQKNSITQNVGTVKNYDKVINKLQKYFDNFSSLVAEFVQQSVQVNDKKNREKCNGTIYILKNKKKPQMLINYVNGPIENIKMEGRFISIINRKTKKTQQYSIKTTPIYNLLSGGIEISQLKPIIIVNSDDITVNIKHNNQNITLVFETKKINNDFQITKLMAWTIDDDKTVINVGFDSKKYYINDTSKLPHDIFETKK